jgi:hypothetical protein
VTLLRSVPMRARRLAALALSTALLSDAGAASGQPRRTKRETPEELAEKKACVEAHTTGQSLAREGKLGDARKQFITCGREACPGAIRKDCADWLAEATESQPSIVVEARDEQGKQTTDVKVYVDDVLVADALDGRAIEVDPGTHSFRYVSKKGSALDERVVILEGQKNRKLAAVFPRAPAPPRPFRLPLLSLVLGGVGAGALGNFVFWGALGSSKEGDLEDTCAPRCTQDDADTMHRHYLLADISLGLSVAAFGGAVVVALTRQDDEAPADEGATRAELVVGPSSLGLRGSF